MAAPQDPFDALCAVTPLADGHFQADFPTQWLQGRGLYGGLVTAVLIRALELAAPGRTLRSLTSELCGAAQPGPALLTVDALRVGSGMSTLAVRLLQGGEVMAHGVGVLGATRPDPVDRVALAPPLLPDWKALEGVEIGPPLGPDFSLFYEYRTTAVPFAQQPPVVTGWVRPRTPGPARDAAFLAGCIDAFWPTEFMGMELPRPIATVAFTFQPFVDFGGLDPDAPLYFRSALQASRGGYGVEFRELWGADGRLLALNQQTICTIK